MVQLIHGAYLRLTCAYLDQREPFLTIAKDFNIPSHAVVLNIMPKICVQRVTNRENHEGGVQGTKGARIVHFHKNAVLDNVPKIAEGFTSVQICNDPDAVAGLLEFWKGVQIGTRTPQICMLAWKVPEHPRMMRRVNSCCSFPGHHDRRKGEKGLTV